MVIKKNIFLPILTVCAIALALVAVAQVDSITPDKEDHLAGQITFPVAELAGCADKAQCRAYCSEPDHMDACIKFAKTHGLMNETEAEMADKFRNLLNNGESPGRCSSEDSCKDYCSDVSRMEECLSFARKVGASNEEINQAEKISSYLKSGGAMPGQCSSKQLCENYCSDFSHAQECFDFSQKAGLNIAQGEDKIPPGQFQKFLALAKENKTPGQCKSRQECENYCKDTSHFKECIQFAKEAGFISEEQAEIAEKTGGRGPGGCDSESSCRAYCNDSVHREECFSFAKEHHIISEEELNHAKEGLVRLKQGLEQAPPEIASCLRSVLGSEVVDKIQSGEFVPGPETGEKIKECFQKFHHDEHPSMSFSKVPPEVSACLKDKLGDSFERVSSGQEMPTPEMADVFRVCFESLRLSHETDNPENFSEGHGERRITKFLHSAPPDIQSCLRDKLGDELEKIKSGQEDVGPEIKDKMKECFSQFKPQEQEYHGGEEGPRPSENIDIMGCVKNKISEEEYSKLVKGEKTPEVQQKINECINSKQSVPFQQQYQQQYQMQKDRRTGICPAAPYVPCPAGTYEKTYYNQDGCPIQQCIPGEGTTGTQYQSGACGDHIKQEDCAQYAKYGCYWNGTACIGSTGTNNPEHGCPLGSYWDGRTCVSSTGVVPSSQEDPAKACTSKGGTWNGDACTFPPTIQPLPPTPTTEIHACPEGQYWNGSYCVSSTSSGTTETSNCASGQYWNGKECVASSATGTTDTHSCPSGTYWNGSSCVASGGTYNTQPSSPDPAAECASKGGNWDGTACKFSKAKPNVFLGALMQVFKFLLGF